MRPDPYLTEIQQNLPRLLALFDTDATSLSHGIGDRYYWAWGLIDFGNGSFQGAAHGLARLWHSGLWPYPTPVAKFVARIDAIFAGAARLTRRDGSLEEAFPNEGSFCVTALVAFDLLCALELLDTIIDAATRQRWQGTIAPMAVYLQQADETHAVISNHLAAAVAALVRWHRLTRDGVSETRARELLERILQHQSDEGWFKEYQGADPGYQSLCTYYLADVHLERPDWSLRDPLRRSLRFLWHFAHPDGSFGGLYGSRCTRFYFPAGVDALAQEIPEAAVLSRFMSESIRDQHVATLSTMDEPNLVPMFNAYCWAAALAGEQRALARSDEALPALDTAPSRRYLARAGLLIDRGPNHYTIVAASKGGVTYHFVAGALAVLDAGVVVRNQYGALASSQAWNDDPSVTLDRDTMIVVSTITEMPKRLPGPWQFLALRVLCVTAFRFARIREWAKRRLVWLLITRARCWPVHNVRTIALGETLEVCDATELPAGCSVLKGVQRFTPIHMASQGYWQAQDEE